jgi:sec-independent protein translocase protein TatB
MFDIGFSELLMVGLVGLIVIGPDKLPGTARTIGMWVGRIRRSVTSIQREISEELKVEELQRKTAMTKEKLAEELGDVTDQFKRPSFGDDSAVSKTAEDAPKPEFNPAAWTNDPDVVAAYQEAYAPKQDEQTTDNAQTESAAEIADAGNQTSSSDQPSEQLADNNEPNEQHKNIG